MGIAIFGRRWRTRQSQVQEDHIDGEYLHSDRVDGLRRNDEQARPGLRAFACPSQSAEPAQTSLCRRPGFWSPNTVFLVLLGREL